MLSKLKRFRRTAVFSLTLWYLLVFILSSLCLFGITYFLLYSSLHKEDEEFISGKLGELSARYNQTGLPAMIGEINTEKAREGDDPYFVRIADANNHAIYMNMPQQWGGFKLGLLEKHPPVAGQWIRIPRRRDTDVLEVSSQILSDGRILQIGKSTGERNDYLEHALKLFAEVMGPLILLGFLGGYFLAWRILLPVRHLVDTVRLIVDTGQMGARVGIRETKDEMGELVALFNRMLDKIEMLIKGMRDALDNVAHDLRTPIARLRGTAEAALVSGREKSSREALSDCMEESDRVLTMLRTLMDISEAELGTMKLNWETLNGPAVFDQLVDVYRYVADEKNISISTDIPDGLTLNVDRGRFMQAVSNLLDNAVKYTPEGGRVSIKAFTADGRTLIQVEDTGQGIPSEEQPKIWDRLYRGDKSRSQPGLGLGLSFVKAIVSAHGGSVSVDSQPDSGSKFQMDLPASQHATITG